MLPCIGYSIHYNVFNTTDFKKNVTKTLLLLTEKNKRLTFAENFKKHKNMKKISFLLLLMGCFWTTAMSFGYSSTSAKSDKIDLKGNLKQQETRSLTESPIEAYLVGNRIEVIFQANLGTIAVSIEDEAGILVYRQSFTVTDGLQIVIPISDWTSGFYTIEFVNPEGQYLEGSFEIE